MDTAASWMIYGANGYTGRLIAEEAVRRGMRPVLAGRRPDAIAQLAERLDCPWRSFGLDTTAEIAQALEGQRVVLHCAGPFSATSGPMIAGCLAAKAHYLDISGEISAIESAAARHADAAAAGISVIPAVGFDVVPSDSMAAMLARELPGASRLELAFTGTGTVSPGTAKTMLENAHQGGRVRIDGRIERVPFAWKTRMVPFRHKTLAAMTIPWGDVASAWYSTGIPNIEVYLAMPAGMIRALRLAGPMTQLARLRPVRAMLGKAIERFIAGPSEQERRGGRAGFWGRASDPAGRYVEATMTTINGYSLTVVTALECLERVLAGSVRAGFSTPSQAFGAEIILAVADTDWRWESRP